MAKNEYKNSNFIRIAAISRQKLTNSYVLVFSSPVINYAATLEVLVMVRILVYPTFHHLFNA